jgi:hypothetical protein
VAAFLRIRVGEGRLVSLMMALMFVPSAGALIPRYEQPWVSIPEHVESHEKQP